MSEPERLLEELQAIKFLLTISNSEAVDKYMNKMITSTIRRKMWTLIDGIKMPSDIGQEAGVTPMAVSKFLSSITDIVKYDKGKPPRKVIEYTPPDWIKEIEEAEAKKKPQGESQVIETKGTELKETEPQR